MITYSKENLKLMYLSPYVQMRTANGTTLCYNSIRNTLTQLKLPHDSLTELQNGISYEELISHFEKCNMGNQEVVNLIKLMIQRGIIE